ncbi:hypothetical protein, partial [Stenotrophomonas sp. SY1]|uniref:hypothetical protein n=1 Tax=Stenotrophomonas sp. SY1 TaxID=477235 RepID=UPI001E4969E6
MSDVVTIIRGGGSARKTGQGGLLALYDAGGQQVEAWQNAIKAAVTFLRYDVSDATEQAGPEPSEPTTTVDLCQLPAGDKKQRFCALRNRVKELADYFEIAGKRPPRIVLSPVDFAALIRGANHRIACDARAAARAENARRKAERIRGQRAKPVYTEVQAMTWNGIPIVEGPAYSKHRPFDFTPLPTTS